MGYTPKEFTVADKAAQGIPASLRHALRLGLFEPKEGRSRIHMLQDYIRDFAWGRWDDAMIWADKLDTKCSKCGRDNKRKFRKLMKASLQWLWSDIFPAHAQHPKWTLRKGWKPRKHFKTKPKPERYLCDPRKEKS